MTFPKIRTASLHSIRVTLFAQTALIVALTTFCMVVTAFALAGNEVQRETLDHLDSVVASREEIITSLIARQREQVAILGNEDATMIPSATKRLVQLHALMARTAQVHFRYDGDVVRCSERQTFRAQSQNVQQIADD
jgi:hypothetical protein